MGSRGTSPIALPCLPTWLSCQQCGSHPWPPERLHLRQNMAKYSFLTVLWCCAAIPPAELRGWRESRLFVFVFADYRVVRAIRNCRAIRRLLYISCKPEGEAMRNFLE